MFTAASRSDIQSTNFLLSLISVVEFVNFSAIKVFPAVCRKEILSAEVLISTVPSFDSFNFVEFSNILEQSMFPAVYRIDNQQRLYFLPCLSFDPVSRKFSYSLE